MAIFFSTKNISDATISGINFSAFYFFSAKGGKNFSIFSQDRAFIMSFLVAPLDKYIAV